jgi:hypothetical protein
MTNIIQSIQPFSISMTTATTAGTVAITAVNTSMSVIFPCGVRSLGTNVNEHSHAAAQVILTSSVLVTANRHVVSGNTVFVAGTVVEFANFVNSIQTGAIAVTTATTGGTAAINAVSTRAFVIYQGVAVTNTTAVYGGSLAGVTLNSSVEVGASIAASSVAQTIRFAVVDLTSDIIASVEQINLEVTSTSSVDTATIASVDVGRTILVDGGRSNTTAAAATHPASSIAGFIPQLAGATSVTFTRATTAAAFTRRHLASVVQLQAQALATTVQRGTIALSSNVTVATATIAAVSTLAVLNVPIKCQRCSTTTSPQQGLYTGSLASTLVTITRGGTANSATGVYEVFEWASSINLGGASTSVGSGLVYGNLLSGHVRSPVNRAHYIMQGSV